MPVPALGIQRGVRGNSCPQETLLVTDRRMDNVQPSAWVRQVVAMGATQGACNSGDQLCTVNASYMQWPHHS